MKDNFKKALTQKIDDLKKQHQENLKQKFKEHEKSFIQAKFELYNTTTLLKQEPDNSQLIATEQAQKARLDNIKSSYRNEVNEFNSANEKSINLEIDNTERDFIAKQEAVFNNKINPLIKEVDEVNKKIDSLRGELEKEEGDLLSKFTGFLGATKQNINHRKVSELQALVETENTHLMDTKSQIDQLTQLKKNATNGLKEVTTTFKNNLSQEQENALAKISSLKIEKEQKVQAVPKPIDNTDINRILATTYLLTNNVLDIVAGSSNKIEGIGVTEAIAQIPGSNWSNIGFISSINDARNLYNDLSAQSQEFSDIGALLSSPAVQAILSDPGIFSTLSINAEAGTIGKFIDAFQDEVGGIVSNILPKTGKPKVDVLVKTVEVNKSALSLEDQLNAAEKLLTNPEFLKFIDVVIKNSQANIQNLIVQNPKLNSDLKQAFGVEAENIAALVPVLSSTFTAIASQQGKISEIFQILKPIISSEIIPATDEISKEKTKIKITLNKEAIDVLLPIAAKVITDENFVDSIASIITPENLKLMGDTFAGSNLPYAKELSNILKVNPQILDPLAATTNSLLDELSKNKEYVDKLVDTAKNAIQVGSDGKISIKPNIIELHELAVASVTILPEPVKSLSGLLTKENTALLFGTFGGQIQSIVKDNVTGENKEAIASLAVNANVQNLAGQIVEKAAEKLPVILAGYANNAEQIKKILEKSVKVENEKDEAGKEKTKIKITPNKKSIDALLPIAARVITDENFVDSIASIITPENLKLMGDALVQTDLPFTEEAFRVLKGNPQILDPLAATTNSLLSELSKNKEYVDKLVDTAKNAIQVGSDGKISIKPKITELHELAVASVTILPEPVKSLSGLLTKENTTLLLSAFSGQVRDILKDSIADLNTIAGFDISSQSNKDALASLAGNGNVQNLAGQVVEKAANCIPTIISAYEEVAPVITKLLEGKEEFKNGVFNPANDLNAEDITTILTKGIDIAKEIDIVDIITKNEEVLKAIVSSITTDQLYSDAVPLFTKLAPLFASQEKLESFKTKVIPSLTAMMDSTVEDKNKNFRHNLFEVTDFFTDIIKSTEFSAIYDLTLHPYIVKHKDALAVLIQEELIDKNPTLQKIQIKPKQIVNVIADKSLLPTIEKFYDHVKHNDYLKAAGYGVKAMFQSQDVRSIVNTALIEGAKVFLKEKLIPNFMRQALVGNTINKTIDEFCKQKEVVGGELKDLGKAFNDQAKSAKGMIGYTFSTKTCIGLDIKPTNFANTKIEGFNFKEATFVGNEELSFKGARIKNTNFSNVTFKGNSIDLSGATVDLKTLKTLIPALKKAREAGKEIKTENMCIEVKAGKNTKLEELEQLVSGNKPDDKIDLSDKINVKVMAKNFVDEQKNNPKVGEYVEKLNINNAVTNNMSIR